MYSDACRIGKTSKITKRNKEPLRRFIHPTTHAPEISTLTSRGTVLRTETTDRPDRRKPRHLRFVVSLCECTTRSRSYFFCFPMMSSLSPSSPSASPWLSFTSFAVVRRRRTRRYSGFYFGMLKLPLVSTLLLYILSRLTSRRCFSHRLQCVAPLQHVLQLCFSEAERKETSLLDSLDWSRKFEVFSTSRLYLSSLGFTNEQIQTLSDEDMQRIADTVNNRTFLYFEEDVKFAVWE